MNLHHYRATDVNKIPPYDEYDFARGIASYVDRLDGETAKSAGMRYLGYGTDKEIKEQLKFNSKPKKSHTTHYFGSGR